MPSRPRTHQLAELAINRLHARFEAEGWTVEDLTKDYGEDLLVRLFEDESATPYSFFVQAKATDSIARYCRDGSGTYMFPVPTEHLRHWRRLAEPVFLTLYDSQSDQTYWVNVQHVTQTIAVAKKLDTQSTVSIPIPITNGLDPDGILRIRGITRFRFDRLAREREGAELLMELQKTDPGFKVSHYDPGNEYVDIETDSGHVLIFLGDAAERMEGYLKGSSMTPDEFLHKAALAYLEKPRNETTRARERELMQELRRKAERQAGRRSLLG